MLFKDAYISVERGELMLLLCLMLTHAFLAVQEPRCTSTRVCINVTLYGCPLSPRIWPVAPNMELLSGQVDAARHSRSASVDQEPYSNRTSGAFFHVVSCV